MKIFFTIYLLTITIINNINKINANNSKSLDKEHQGKENIYSDVNLRYQNESNIKSYFQTSNQVIHFYLLYYNIYSIYIGM
jgi:hypothetical protein